MLCSLYMFNWELGHRGRGAGPSRDIGQRLGMQSPPDAQPGQPSLGSTGLASEYALHDSNCETNFHYLLLWRSGGSGKVAGISAYKNASKKLIRSIATNRLQVLGYMVLCYGFLLVITRIEEGATPHGRLLVNIKGRQSPSAPFPKSLVGTDFTSCQT